jgi:glycosyltransferase involved in cell wall biosynthesis
MGGSRVGLVCGYLDPVRDGVADYTGQLARHLPSVGVHPVICTAYRCVRTAGPQVVGVTGRWNVPGVRRAARVIARLRLDVVHVQFAPSAFGFCRAVGLLPGLVACGTPVVVTVHEYGVWAPGGPGGRLRSVFWSAVERWGGVDREMLLLPGCADRLLVTAPEHLQVLGTRFPGRALAAQYVPIGPNIAVAPVDRHRAAAAVRIALGRSPQALLAVFFGFLHPVKGLARLIEAVARVRQERPNLELVFAGGQESHSVPAGAAAGLRRDLEEVARGHGVADHVVFTGYLPEDDISRLLLAADTAVFPFDNGVTAKSGSLLAALCHGVPTIATSPPGTLTQVREVEGVLRVPPRDTAALAEALRRVLGDRALAGRLAAAGAVGAAARTWPAIAATHAKLYAEVLHQHARGASQDGGPGIGNPTRMGTRDREARG